jgi:fatty-acyl-CoA synthase
MSAMQLSYACGNRSDSVSDCTIGQALQQAAAAWGGRVALVDGTMPGCAGGRWTFDALLRDAEHVARFLLARFRPGEHIAVWAPNRPEWVLLEFGAALAGLTLVTVNPAYRAEELAYVLNQSDAVGLFTVSEYRERNLLAVVDSIRPALPALRANLLLGVWGDSASSTESSSELPAVRPEDIAQIQYTSGTTGMAKGALLTHRGMVNNARFYARCIGATEEDVWLNPMPMFHTAGCGLATLGALQTGGVQVLPAGFDAGLMLRLLETDRASITPCVPTMLLGMLDHPEFSQRNLSSWRLITLGGAPVSPELVRRARRQVGAQVAIGFGQTESSPYITHTSPGDPVEEWITTVGRPLPQCEVKIVDPIHRDTLPIGQIGEICARGYAVMKGYYKNPEATAATLDGEGWLFTGDLGSLDARGYCRIEGRLKDMIIRGGENIYPREIEQLLSDHPAVADAAVVGIPDDVWGEIPVAFIRLSGDVQPTEEELRGFCRQHLAAYKTPRHWRFVAQFPLTASGKIQKFVLRDQFVNSTPHALNRAERTIVGSGEEQGDT